MDLIYADIINGKVIDRGVLSNYTFDLSYGADENDFQLVLPVSGTRLQQDQLIYIPGTEYGGVIDSIKVDTSTQMMTYSGRTWHGILENKILYPEKGRDYMFVNGEANEVLGLLLERMNIIPGNLNELYIQPENPVITVSEADSNIWISGIITSESGNYAHGYSFIRDLLYQHNAKPKIVDGVLFAEELVDYSNDDDFLEGTDQFVARRNYNSLTRLHCLGQGELSHRKTIDIYLDENGGVLPYSRENVITDDDYYTDINALAQSTVEEDVANFATLRDNMITGINEISEVYDYPNAQTTYHYVMQETQPSDWATDTTPGETDLKKKVYGYENYFFLDTEDNDTFKSVPATDVYTDHVLQEHMPSDWISEFDSYYEDSPEGYVHVAKVNAYDPVPNKPDGWEAGAYSNYYKLNESGHYSKVTQVSGKIPWDDVPDDWETAYMNYYELKDGKYVKVKGIKQDPIYKKLDKEPPDWKSNFKDYYWTDGVQYKKVTGVSKDEYYVQTRQPSDWKKNWKAYYKIVKKKKVQLTDPKAPPWKAKKYYTKLSATYPPAFKDKKNPMIYYKEIQPDDAAPTFVPGQYYTSGKVVPAWGSETFYQKRNYPIWDYNKYYTAVDTRPVPVWHEGDFYTRYEDHYQALVEGALKKIEDMNVKDEIDINLDEKRIYDINDRVGASDEVTGLGAVERITQKIVKINRGIVSFDYNTGK